MLFSLKLPPTAGWALYQETVRNFNGISCSIINKKGNTSAKLIQTRNSNICQLYIRTFPLLTGSQEYWSECHPAYH